MYKSPIHIIESTMGSFAQAIVKQKDDAIFAEIQHSFGVDLDRGELIRALQYDRDQYEKGYADGKRDAINDLVRCKDCIHMKNQFNARFCDVWCMYNGMGDEGFCNYGERKDNESYCLR